MVSIQRGEKKERLCGLLTGHYYGHPLDRKQTFLGWPSGTNSILSVMVGTKKWSLGNLTISILPDYQSRIHFTKIRLGHSHIWNAAAEISYIP